MSLTGETVGSRSARHNANSVSSSNKVLVAVKAERVISNTALAWALTHVVHSSDSITLLAVYSAEKTGRRFWNFSRLAGDCSSRRAGKLPERISEISESCAQMVLQLHNQIEELDAACGDRIFFPFQILNISTFYLLPNLSPYLLHTNNLPISKFPALLPITLSSSRQFKISSSTSKTHKSVVVT